MNGAHINIQYIFPEILRFFPPAKYERFSCTGRDTDSFEKEVRKGSENNNTNMCLKMRRRINFFSKYQQCTMVSQ